MEQARYQLEYDELQRSERAFRKSLQSARNLAILGLVFAIAAMIGAQFFPTESAERLVLRILGSVGVVILIAGLAKRSAVVAAKDQTNSPG